MGDVAFSNVALAPGAAVQLHWGKRPSSLDDNGGFADYASCNAPEAGCYPVPGWEQRCPLALPTCGCWNFADRMPSRTPRGVPGSMALREARSRARRNSQENRLVSYLLLKSYRYPASARDNPPPYPPRPAPELLSTTVLYSLRP